MNGTGPRSAVPEKLEDALPEECRGVRPVGAQAGIGEIVLVAGVQEELRVRGRRDESAGSLEIAFVQDRIRVHAVDLHGYTRRPRRPGFRDRQTRVEQQRTARSGAGLSELLRRHDAKREPSVDELRGEGLRRALAALDDLAEPDLPRVRDAFSDRLERSSAEEVRCVDRVPGLTQLVGEGENPRGLTQGVVEEQLFGHIAPCRTCAPPRERRDRLPAR